MLNKIRPASSRTDHLFVGTDRSMYFVLSWNSLTKRLQTERSYVDQADKSARDVQTEERCHTDPSGSYMTLEIYEGCVNVLPITKKIRKEGDAEIGSLGEPIPVRIPELFVRASTFFELKIRAPKEKPKLALIYDDNYNRRVRLRIREIDFSPGLSGDGPSAELSEVPTHESALHTGDSHLIPVQRPACGLLILGEVSITYWELSEKRKLRKPLQQAAIWVTWTQIDYQRYLIADEYGKLYLLMLEIDTEDNVTGWQLDALGETSKATTLQYIGDGRVFVGSHTGDSVLVEIRPKAIEIVQRLPNIAPIIDFTIMDMGNRSGEGQVNEFSSGQARLVTGSGAFSDGSLRSVRSGVGLEDQGILDQMDNVTGMFAMKSNPSSHHNDILIVSFVDSTRIFHFQPDETIEEYTEFAAMRLDAGTLYAGNVVGGKALQVTADCIQISDLESGMVASQWKPSNHGKITALTTNEHAIVAAVNGVELHVFDISADLQTISSKASGFESQIACINLPTSDATFLMIGFWETSNVSVLSLKDLSLIYQREAAPGQSTVPRSLLLANIFQDQPPILFIALADGNVVTFSMDMSTGTLSNRKSIVLGTQQADLRILPRLDGLHNVFAICEQPSLIYGSEGRLTYSAITAEKATCVCPLDPEFCPGAIAIASQTDLRIAVVDEERSTHVQGLPVGETVRRIAHSSKLSAFGLGTMKRTLEGNAECVQSHFKLADEVTFAIQATYNLNEEELIECVIPAELPDGHGKLAERFVIGTAYVEEDNNDSVRGRIIVLEVTEDRQLKVVTELSVRGGCRALTMLEGKIVAALIKTVAVYALEYTTISQPALIKQASFRTSTAPMDIAMTTSAEGKPTVAVADLMKSVSIVQYTRGQAGLPDRLLEVARHFSTVWTTAVEVVDPEEGTYLTSDAEGNLLVLKHNTQGVTSEDRRRLQITSEICLSECVNRIQRIDVPVAPNAPVVPRAFLATTEGSIHLFATIRPNYQDLLMKLQASLAELVQSPGNVPFGTWRGFRSQVREEQEPFRFVDGELVESFLELSSDGQKEVLGRAGVDIERLEEIRGLVEGLRRLR